jgi:hypothetical protein
VFSGRGQGRATTLATLAAIGCGLLLILAWFAGRPGRRR